MAAMEESGGAKKRKRASAKPSKPKAKGSKKLSKPSKTDKPADARPKKAPETPRERRLAAKEMSEARKKKRKPYYNLEKELALLWEKMRRTNIAKDEKSKLISEALKKMSGKILEIASSHLSARVLQTCIKYCSQAERESVFGELQPHLLTLSQKKYAVHLVKKLLDTATKKQLEWFISSLHGHVAFLLRHTVASAVVDHAYQLGNGSQKQALLLEMYSTELQLFKDLTRANAGRLLEIISKLGLQKSSVLQHMNTVIQPILEKGILDYSIVYTALVEYFTIADRSSATDVIQQLLPLLVQEPRKKNKTQEPRLVRMIHSRDGLKVGILCIKHGGAKERKKIIKCMKEHVGRLACDHYGSLLLICILSVVDDTKLVTKIVIRELQTMLKEVVLDRNGRRPLLELLHPHCPRYLSLDDLACLDLSVPSLRMEGQEAGTIADMDEPRCPKLDGQVTMTDSSESEVARKSMQLPLGGKKNAFLRRYELLVESKLAENLIETCIENIGELIRSNFGREVIYELAVGGTDCILQSLANRLDALHQAIAFLAAHPKMEGSEEEHVFENFHSSRTIRKLVLDSPTFAATLWKTALEGKSENWARGHSCKVVSAFLESSDPGVRELAKSELQKLVDCGILKAPKNTDKQQKKAKALTK